MVAVGEVKGVRDAGQVWPGTSNAYPDRFAGGRSCLEGRQGRQPSLAGYQENFAGGRSHQEASESIKTRR